MKRTFEDGALVVNLLAGDTDDRMTAGRCYRVIGTYDGHSGSGHAQEWTRVADNRGVVVGYDPDRFLLADPKRVANPVVLTTATRMLRRLLKLIKGAPKDGLLATLHSSLLDQIEDAQSIIAASALDPHDEQIVFNEVRTSPEDFNVTVWQISASGGNPFASLTGVNGRGRPTGMPGYTLDFDGAAVELNAMNFEAACAEVNDILYQHRMAREGIDRDFGVWACAVWIEKTKREGIAA